MSQSWRGCNSSDYCINVLYSASRSYLCGSKHKMASALRALKRPGAHSYPFMQSTQQQPLKEILGFWSMNFRQLGEWSPFFVATFYKCEVFGYGTVTNIHITLDSLSYWLLIWLNQRLEEKKSNLLRCARHACSWREIDHFLNDKPERDVSSTAEYILVWMMHQGFDLCFLGCHVYFHEWKKATQ